MIRRFLDAALIPLALLVAWLFGLNFFAAVVVLVFGDPDGVASYFATGALVAAVALAALAWVFINE